jgi:hypothetical protein
MRQGSAGFPVEWLHSLGLGARLRQPRDAWWDWRLGVNTFGHAPAVGEPHEPHWRGHYATRPYEELFGLLHHVGLGPQDVFVDFGSGLGRAVFVASWLGAGRSVGVEVNPVLCGRAVNSHRRSRLAQRDVRFVCQPAQQFSSEAATVVYLLHPFGAGTLDAVAQRLTSQAAERNGPLRIVYHNPVHAAVLDRYAGLVRMEVWGPEPHKGRRYPIAFYSGR